MTKYVRPSCRGRRAGAAQSRSSGRDAPGWSTPPVDHPPGAVGHRGGRQSGARVGSGAGFENSWHQMCSVVASGRSHDFSTSSCACSGWWGGHLQPIGLRPSGHRSAGAPGSGSATACRPRDTPSPAYAFGELQRQARVVAGGQVPGRERCSSCSATTRRARSAIPILRQRSSRHDRKSTPVNRNAGVTRPLTTCRRRCCRGGSWPHGGGPPASRRSRARVSAVGQ